MHTLPPTTILDNLTLVTVAAVPPIRPTHDSQAVEITLDTPARPSHEGSRPLSAMQNDPRTGYHLTAGCVHGPPQQFSCANEASDASQTTAEGSSLVGIALRGEGVAERVG
ncbi:hypothetical protein GGF50DRAFT_121907 [Schizophyllum commune]